MTAGSSSATDGDAAVKVVGLSKRYRIVAHPGAGGLYDSVGRLMGRRGQEHEASPTVWALRDVNFEVAAGRVLGVMGRNGSGKTTLMKILARVTGPTEGRAEVDRKSTRLNSSHRL